MIIISFSITQNDPIQNFEVYGKNLKKISDTFEHLIKPQTINEKITNNNGSIEQVDSIFPFTNNITTSHLIIRGVFERLSICIYGNPCSNQESLYMIENSRNDISLEKIE